MNDAMTDIAAIVYNGLSAHGFENGDFDLYRKKCIAGLRAGTHGGMVIVKDGRVGWIDWYTPSFGIRITHLKAMLQVSCLLDIDYLAVDCERSANIVFSRRIATKLKFQEITKFLYSIKLKRETGDENESVVSAVDRGRSCTSL